MYRRHTRGRGGRRIMSRERVSCPSGCFIHPQAVSSHGSYQFQQYKGTKEVPQNQTRGSTMYELRCVNRERDSDDGKGEIGRRFRGTLNEAERKLFRPQKTIRMSLTERLKTLSEKRGQQKFVARLEARFGKMTWGGLPERVYSEKYSIESLAGLLFAKDSRRNIFNTDVKPTNARYIRPTDQDAACVLESFNVQMTTGADKLDICLQVEKKDDGGINLQVLMAIKNDVKDATFNILNLHREYDVRIMLNHCEYVKEDDSLHAIVREMAEKISFPSHGKVRIQPKTAQWKVHFIRHKKKFTYMIDDKFAITIADVSEHNIDNMKGEDIEFDMRMENAHMEVELHNLAWQCAFRRDGDLSSTHDHSGSGTDTRRYDTIPHPWQPEDILRDFDTFWGHLDTLSDRLDGLSL